MLGQLIALNGPEPANGSLARLKLMGQLVPPLVVAKTWPVVLASVAKQTLVVAQLIALSVVEEPRAAGALQLVPLMVLMNVPVGVIA
jgi:hypothetical protein